VKVCISVQLIFNRIEQLSYLATFCLPLGFNNVQFLALANVDLLLDTFSGVVS